MSRFQRSFLLILVVYCISSLGQAYDLSMDLFGFIILFAVGFFLALKN